MNQKGFANVFAVVAVVLLIVAGYFLLAGKSSQVDKEQNVSVPADWKTYTNAEYEFEVKYPSNWLQSMHSGDIAFTDADCSDCAATSISITFLEQFKNKKLEEIYNGNGWAKIDFEKYCEKIMFVGVSAYECRTVPDSRDSEKPAIFFYHNDMPVVISDDFDNEISRQILSTFKFIESTKQADASAWKTYKNQTYAFQFKYPEDWQIETQSFAGDNTVFIKPVSEKRTCFAKILPTSCITIAIDPSSNGDLGYFEQNSTTQSDLTIGDRAAKRFILKSREMIMVPLEGKPILLISREISLDNEVFKNILSTFKFTK